MINLAKKSDKKGGVSPISAALAGAAVGAAALALSNKDTRKKIKKLVDDLKVKGDETLDEIRQKVEAATKEGKKALAKKLKL